jgi:uncharacterized protein with HEPN domain
MSAERPPHAWLIDARAYALEAQRIADSQTSVRRDLLAIRYCLMVVGEALYWVPETMLVSEPAIPWPKVIALRHRLVHGYWLIDEDIIVEIARNEIGPLVSTLTRLIEKFA